MPDTPIDPRDKASWVDKPPEERIAILGHRAYVGGGAPAMWFGLGRRQFHFLVSQGLRPEHRFLDIACGSLRLGQFLIPFLDDGHYFGLEAEPALVAAGLREELLYNLAKQKRPTFSYGYDFNFDFVEHFDFAIAQSLFTHLTRADCLKCLVNLRKVPQPGTLFMTFKQGTAPHPDGPSHAQKGWQYTRPEMEEIVAEAGWTPHFIGDWGHERNQQMIRATPA